MNRPLFVLGFVLCLSSFSDEAQPERPSEVKQTMRGNFSALLELQPYLLQASKFSDPANRDAILAKLAALSSVKHVFSKPVPQEEPGLAVIASLFSDYLADAQSRFEQGNHEYARQRIKALTGFCFACHSRLGDEKTFHDAWKRVELSGLSPKDKAEFFAATRQFDKALETYREVLENRPDGEAGFFEFTRALRQALRLTVGAKDDPQATEQLIEGLLKKNQLPPGLVADLRGWKADVQTWKKDSTDVKKLSVPQLVKKARALVDRGLKSQAFPADEQGDISFLRANALLHRALEKDPKHKLRGEVLYLLGVCAHALRDQLFWEMDLVYWEACIREYPHTREAARCFRRYREKVYQGYTGSKGMDLPQPERDKLGALRTLSEKK